MIHTKEELIFFLDFAFKNSSHEGENLCSCVKCGLITSVNRRIAFENLICNGFVDGYTKWVLHGETSSHATQNIDTSSDTHESNYTLDM